MFSKPYLPEKGYGSLMTIADTNAHFAKLAEQKLKDLRDNPVGFFISAMLAGAYVGIGIILIISVGENADPAFKTLIMGVSFGIALTLVVFAGSELFTGYTMFMPQGLLSGGVGVRALLNSWVVVWVGNLVGCIALAAIAVVGAIDIVSEKGDLLYAIAEKKMHLSATQLVARAMLCNWLVCLALWTSARTTNDAAKILLIFWCLFAFIASGFEHSVANMTVFALALLSEHPEGVTYIGAAKNLFWVTIGNTISGAILVAASYWLIGGNSKAPAAAKRTTTQEEPTN